MKKLLALLLIFSSHLNYAQDLELEDIDDLSILDEFAADEEESGNVEDNEENIGEDIGDDKDVDELEISDSETLTDEEKKVDDDLEFLEETENSSRENLEEIGLDEPNLDNVNPFEEIELDDEYLSSNQEGDDEIDFKLIQEFSKMNKDNLVEVLKDARKREDAQFTNFELEALKVQLRDIVKSSLRLAHIPKGASLTRIKDDHIVYTTKPLTVRAYTLLDFNKNRYIIDKKGNIVYKLYYKNLADIKTITTLYRKPHKFIRLPKQEKKINFFDKSFPYSFNANLHLGINFPTYTNDLVDSDDSGAALFRSEFSFLSKKNLVFNSGFAFMYETLTGSLKSGDTYQINAFSVGPHVRVNEFWGDLAFIVQPRISIFSQAAITRPGDIDVIKQSETSLMFALESETNYAPYGHMSLGISFQKKWINTSTQNASYTISDSTKTDDSLSFYIGHRSDWIW